MNENIDLKEILKDCPNGFKLYTPLFGEVAFEGIGDSEVYPIVTNNSNNIPLLFSKEGFYCYSAGVECLLFPSAEQRDWRKFKARWYKKEKFDPETFAPFDKVLVRDAGYKTWKFDLFSHIVEEEPDSPYVTLSKEFRYCIPYNDDTKHLIGKIDEAPEYYRYWE